MLAHLELGTLRGLSRGTACDSSYRFESFDLEGLYFYFVLLLSRRTCARFLRLIFFAGFQKGLEVCGTEYLGRIMTSLCLKVLSGEGLLYLCIVPKLSKAYFLRRHW